MALPILGVDIAKETFQSTLIVEGKKYRHSFRNHTDGFEALSQWLDKRQALRVHACMEATGTYWEALADFLHDAGHVVSVVNPSRIRAYSRSKLMRNKTDKLDADIIADFCQTQNPVAWVPLPPEIRELRLLVRHLEDLQHMRTQESNRLSSGVSSSHVRQMIETHLDFIDQQIKTLQQRIEEHISQHPDLREKRDLLVSIPGIGPITAAKLLSENVQSFSKTRLAVAFAGLNPQIRESGSSIRGQPHLSKIGSSNLRKALYFPAISAMRFNPVVREFCERLSQRNKPKMVIVGAAMRKLLCLVVGVLKSGVPFDPSRALSPAATI